VFGVAALERQVKQCAICQNARKMPPSGPLHPWEWPGKPWSRLHIDYSKPFMGRMLLIIIDAHLKWLEVYNTNSSTTAVTVEKLRDVFSRFDLLEMIVSDNAMFFTSDEFKQFLKANGIRHTRSTPYHPTTNGLAEWAMQTVKEGLRKAKEGSLQTKLLRFLFQYHLSSHTTTGVSLSKLLTG